MPLVPAKCPNCGGDIKIDSESRAGICEFCKNPFVAEDAINNYNTYNQNSYNIANAEVHIHDEKSIEQKLEAAEIFFTKHHDIQEATRLFTEVSKEAPGNYQAWWGLVRLNTNDFQDKIIKTSELEEAYMYAQRACAVAPVEQLNSLRNKWNDYIESANQTIRNEIASCKIKKMDINKSIEELEEKHRRLEGEKNYLTRKIDESEKRKESSAKLFSTIGAGAVGLGVMIGLVGCVVSVERGHAADSFILGLVLMGIGLALFIAGSVFNAFQGKEIPSFEKEREALIGEVEKSGDELYKERQAKEWKEKWEKDLESLKSKISSLHPL